MNISIFLAQFWGWLLVISCLPFLLRRKFLDDLFESVQDKRFLLISGYIALVLGLTTVILHNTWTAGWRVIITIFGWLSLLKGIVRIGWPELTQKIVPLFQRKLLLSQALLVIAILLGAWLIWASY